MKIDKYIIVKRHYLCDWMYVVKKEHWLFGYRYLRCFGNGDITNSISPIYDIKYFYNERDAEECINNLLYKKTIER